MLHRIQFLKIVTIMAMSVILSSVSHAQPETAPLSSEARKRLDEINLFLNSKSFKEKLQTYENVISEVRGIEPLQDNDVDTDRNHVPVMFVSSSIPIATLRSYAVQLGEAGGGVMVLRGLVGRNGLLQPTLAFINKVINVDAKCDGPQCEKHNVQVLIDPLFFQFHNVTQVPAFTVYEQKAFEARCSGDESFEQAAIIYGDASVKGLVIELLSIDDRSTVKMFAKKIGV